MWKQIEPFDLLKSIPAKNIVWLVITVTKIAFSLLQSTYQKLWQKHPEKTDTEKVPGPWDASVLKSPGKLCVRFLMSDHFVTWASWFWSSLYVLWLCSRWDTASILESCINMLNCCVSLSFSLAVFFLNLFSPSPLCIPVRSDVSDRIPALSVFHQKSKSVIGLCWFSPCKLPKARLPMIYWLLYQL